MLVMLAMVTTTLDLMVGITAIAIAAMLDATRIASKLPRQLEVERVKTMEVVEIRTMALGAMWAIAALIKGADRGLRSVAAAAGRVVAEIENRWVEIEIAISTIEIEVWATMAVVGIKAITNNRSLETMMAMLDVKHIGRMAVGLAWRETRDVEMLIMRATVEMKTSGAGKGGEMLTLVRDPVVTAMCM